MLLCCHPAGRGPVVPHPRAPPQPTARAGPARVLPVLQVCWCHVHYDEAFSSLREASCKSFCRLHIGPDGDLRMYTLALDEVPSRWIGRGGVE